jgi:hypothetical protein
MVYMYSRRCVRTGDFGGVLPRVAPSVLFGIFQKVISNLVWYMHVLTLSSRHARAPVYRRPCCRSLKAGCIICCILQGRIVTLIRFFDSDQKQIEKIYRYQIWLEIGLNSLFSTKGDLCPSSDDFTFSTLYTGYCTLYTGYCTY